MTRLLFIAMLVLGFADQAFAATIAVEARPEIQLPRDLPTVIIDARHQAADDPGFWLNQAFSDGLFEQAGAPGGHISWHRIDLIGGESLDGATDFVLVADVYILRHLSFFLFAAGDELRAAGFGLDDPVTDASAEPGAGHQGPYFAFDISPGQRLTLLIRKQGEGPAPLPLRLLRHDASVDWLSARDRLWGGAIALLAGMALYNLLIYVIYRSRAYGWYLAFHVAAFAFLAALMGFGQLLWPIQFQRLLTAHILTLDFILVFLLLRFATTLLDAKTISPRHARVEKILSGILLLGAVAGLFVPEHRMLPMFALAFGLAALFTLSMAWQSHRNGSTAARFFMISWVFSIGGGAVGFAAWTQKLPQTPLTLNALLIGIVGELLLFSVALAYRSRDMERQSLERSLLYPDARVASFGYLKERLPGYLPEMRKPGSDLMVLVAGLTGYRELVGLYGPETLGSGFRWQTDHISAYLARKAWSIALPMPTGSPVYLAVLPGEQLFALIDLSRLPDGRDLEQEMRKLVAVAERFSFGESLKVRTRMTIGGSRLVGLDIERAYSQAQVALLMALERGEHWACYDERLGRVIERRAFVAHELRGAASRNELRLHLQPQCQLDTRCVCGGEMLLRWQHPTLGLVSPGEFIALAEQGGMIRRITRWVIDATCRWLAGLDADHPFANLPVSVNLSAIDLADEGLTDFLCRTLRQHGIEHGRMVLEITETAAANEPVGFLDRVRQLKAHGFRLSIDDFGTGYSSMQYLQQIQPFELKIDRSFVRGIHRDATKQGVVEAIIRLAAATGAEVIAEGVEEPEEAQALSALDCRRGQGFLWHKPMPLAAVASAVGVATATLDPEV